MSRHFRPESPGRRLRLATLCSITVLLAASLTSHLIPSRSGVAGARESSAGVDSAQDPAASCCGGEEGDDKPHLLAATYYSLKGGLSAKLLLNNKGPHPLEAEPMLFSMSGERFAVAPVTVEGNSFRLIDIGEWVEGAGPQFQEGSIQVFHLGRDLVLGVQVYLVDEEHRLSFEEKFAEPANSRSSKLRGVWWLPSRKGEVILALSNTSDSPLTVTASADGARPALRGQITVELQPHETRLLDVRGDLFGKGQGAMSRLGGISVEHTGPNGAVLARGFAREVAGGYSLAVQFSDPLGAKSSGYHGAGLRLGAAGGAALTPVVVAYNAGDAAATITGRLPYAAADGGTAEVTLPEVQVPAGGATEIDVARAMRSAGVPADIPSAGLEFEYTTEPGSVQMAALSVGGGRDQVFRVPLWDVAAQRSATGGYPWYIEGSSSTVVYLKNVTDQPQEYVLQLDFEGGVYAPGLKTIGPRQTAVVDIRALRDGQVPDEDGDTIPPGASRGQVMWSVRGPDGLAMVGRSEQVDIERGVSSNYACQSCCPNSFSSATVYPQASTIGVGGSVVYSLQQTDQNCYGQRLAPYATSPDYWYSDNTAVATGGNPATGQGPGTTVIHAYLSVYAYAYYGGVCNAILMHPTPGAGITVVSVTFQRSNGAALPSPLRLGISSVNLDGTTQNRTQQLRAVVTPAAQASSITIAGNKVQVSSPSADATTGIITFGAVGIAPSVQQGDGSITAKVGSTVIRSHPVTVVVPSKLTHNAGGSLVIQNKAMNVTTTPPAIDVPSTQMQLNTIYYKPFTVTVKDKWDVHVGDVYAGAEVTEVVGNIQEASINFPLTSSGTFTDPVGRTKFGITVPASDPRVAAWPSQPKLQALEPGNCSDTGTQNITVFVAGFELDPPIARSVVLCRNLTGAYSLEVTWP